MMDRCDKLLGDVEGWRYGDKEECSDWTTRNKLIISSYWWFVEDHIGAVAGPGARAGCMCVSALALHCSRPWSFGCCIQNPLEVEGGCWKALVQQFLARAAWTICDLAYVTAHRHYCRLGRQVPSAGNSPNSVAYFKQTPIFEWCGYKNRHQKEMCLKEIGLCAQNWLAILGPIVNKIGGTYMIV